MVQGCPALHVVHGGIRIAESKLQIEREKSQESEIRETKNKEFYMPGASD
jgi:hypothetical protein